LLRRLNDVRVGRLRYLVPRIGGGFGCVSTPFAEVRIIESAFDGDDVSYDELMIVH